MKYEILPPVGSLVAPKELMTEKELREFMPSLIGDAEMAETWKEKAAKDPIKEVIDWLIQSGYQVNEIEEK